VSNSRRIACLFLLACVFVLDGYDLNAMPLSVPHLQTSLGLVPAEFGVVFSAVLVGLGGGAALPAPLGARIGRKRVIVAGALAVAAATIGTAMATTITEFLIWRLATGAGLGAILPNCSAMSAELAPGATRARVMTLVSAGIPVGAMAAGLTAPEVVAIGGWHGLFLLPGVFGLLLALALALVLPAQIGGEAAREPPAGKVPQLALFERPWILPFAVYTACLTLNAIGLYMLSQWAPTILPQAGFALDEAARLTGLLQGAGFAFGLALSWLIDRWKPAIAMGAGFAIIAAGFLAIGLLRPDPATWTALLLIAGGGVTGISMALNALVPSLMPSHLFSSTIGMGVLIARIGAIAGPMLGQALLAAGAAPATFFLVLFVPAGLCMLCCLALPKALAIRRAYAPPAA